MQITAQRGAIAITLGDTPRRRTLFYSMGPTWLLVEKYGVGFLGELYTSEQVGGQSRLKLKSLDALRFFLWAGLQEEISGTGEELTEAEVGDFIRPWTMQNIFNAVVMAVTGAVSTPVLPGKAEAAEAKTASQSAARPAAKGSTSTRRSASRVAR
jgi:hypothetical protein